MSLREDIRAILTGAAGTLLAAAVAWLAGWLSGVFDDLHFGPAVPSGFVLPFEQDKCPEGWEPLDETPERLTITLGADDIGSPMPPSISLSFCKKS